ncbi:MAG: BON domain-containing protein, partial [Fibrobacter sp.]|nr:BON domain-containing protein [Fibrobacter sp.]
VKNHLQIQRSEGLKGPNDNEIVKNINTILALNAPLKSSKIEVLSTDGVVTLNGFVDEYWKKIHAEELVFDVQGVYDVINKLLVVPDKSPRDQAIASSIISLLGNVEGISLDKITVEVSGGNVVLKGSVQSWYAYTSAYKIVVYTKGVTGSMLNLTIV